MEVVPAFIDETGVLTQSTKEQPIFGIGLLLVHDPAKVTESFYRLHFSYGSVAAERRSKLREEILKGDRHPSLSELDRLMWSTRHYEYKFSQVSAHNLQHYIDLLNLYFSWDCLEFHALILDRTEPGFSLSQWNNDPWEAYVAVTKDLLERRLSSPVFAVVDLQGQPRSSPVQLEDTLCQAEQVAGCMRASSETQVFLQVVDVLLGCVQADWKEHNGFYKPDSKRGHAKRELVKFLRSKLALSASRPIVSRQERVWETTDPLPFTVTLKGESAAMSGAHPV